jgi:hypothetical protein
MEEHENRKNKAGPHNSYASLLGDTSVLHSAGIAEALNENICIFNECLTIFHNIADLELKEN